MILKIPEYYPDPILYSLCSLFAHVGHRRVKGCMEGAVELPIPVISVGNITFGGTAKTPTVEHLARVLAGTGIHPGVVLRGYRGRLDLENAPPEIVSDGKRIYLDWMDSGDEARMLAESLLADEIPVAVGRDRIEASRLLMDRNDNEIDIIILDDGFQYTSLKRKFDLVLIDMLAPFGRTDGRIGLIREPVRAIERADAVLLTRIEAVERARVGEIVKKLRRSIDNLPEIFTARTVVRSVRDLKSGREIEIDLLNGRRVIAFAGVGNPLSFRCTVESLGCEIAEFVEFQDHHPYTEEDMDRVCRRVEVLGAEYVLTTCKDAIRLRDLSDSIDFPLVVVDIEMEIDDEGRFLEISGVTIR